MTAVTASTTLLSPDVVNSDSSPLDPYTTPQDA
jgi:hypothetical protein